MANTATNDMHTLICLAQNGDENAVSKIVEENMGLVWSIVKRYLGRGTEADDLFQIGSMGLIKAIKKFDISFNVQFSTYAVPMIMGEIKRFLRDDGIIKVSRGLKETALKVKIAREQLLNENEKEPTVSEIASKICISVEDVVLAIESGASVESLNASYQDGESNNLCLLDKIDEKTDYEGKIINKVALIEVLNSFEKKEKQIILLRYFKQKTQTEIANMLGISQVQVSRIEKKILMQMKKKLI